jgi:hypothetical protein
MMDMCLPVILVAGVFVYFFVPSVRKWISRTTGLELFSQSSDIKDKVDELITDHDGRSGSSETWRTELRDQLGAYQTEFEKEPGDIMLERVWKENIDRENSILQGKIQGAMGNMTKGDAEYQKLLALREAIKKF